MKNWKIILSAMLIGLLAMPPAMGQSGCVIPGATTIVGGGNTSPLAADTGKIYVITGVATFTLPATPPTAVWRISFAVLYGGTLTINPSSLQIDAQSSSEVFAGGANVTVSTDGTNYFTSSKGDAKRECDMVFGDASGSALTNAQLGPQKRLCQVSEKATVIEVSVTADSGTPSIIVGRSRCTAWTTGVCTTETRVNLLSGALATNAAGVEACSNPGGPLGLDGGTTCSSTIQNQGLAQGDFLEAVSGTAGGTAKLMTVHITYIVHSGN
jgi:hypothetical protein